KRGQQLFALGRAKGGRETAGQNRPVRISRWHDSYERTNYSAVPSSRLSFSTRVVRLIFRSSAALLRLPPVRSSDRLMRSRSIDARYADRSRPSSGNSTNGADAGGGADCTS